MTATRNKREATREEIRAVDRAIDGLAAGTPATEPASTPVYFQTIGAISGRAAIRCLGKYRRRLVRQEAGGKGARR